MDSHIWRTWRHITKVDPARPWNTRLLRTVVDSGTDAVVIGGTQDMETAGVGRLLAALRAIGATVPIAIEVSSSACLQPGADTYLVPVVLNAGDRWWFIGAHHEVMIRAGTAAEIVPPVPEFYVVLNPDSAVARFTGSICPLEPEEVAAYVRTARLILGAGLVYLEGSGRFMGEELIRAAAEVRGSARLFYGGGITTAEQAELAGRWADTVVVGNLIYDRPEALAETVRAVAI